MGKYTNERLNLFLGISILILLSQLRETISHPTPLLLLSKRNWAGTTEPSTRRLGLSSSSEVDTLANPDESIDMLDGESPTFTPFIGAHALSNMEKFFEHLRENLHAMQHEGGGGGEIDQPERRRMTSGEISSETLHTPEFNSYPEGRFKAMALQVQPQPSVTYRHSSSPYNPASTGRLQKMQTFIQPLTEEESYLRRANNYNPSWLWTNLGLGKRRRRR